MRLGNWPWQLAFGGEAKWSLWHGETQELEKRLLERFDTRLDKQGRVCKDLPLSRISLVTSCLAFSLKGTRSTASCRSLRSRPRVAVAWRSTRLSEHLRRSSECRNATGHSVWRCIW